MLKSLDEMIGKSFYNINLVENTARNSPLVSDDRSNRSASNMILEDDEPLPEGYKLITYHYIFDAKFDRRQKRLD